MQSTATPGPGPGLGGSETPWWKKIGYYLWLLAIGAIVYAYVFSTNASASSDTGIEPTPDPATGATNINVGNQVSLLLGCIVIYMIFGKLWSNGQYQIPTRWVTSIVNAIITFGLLIGLVFVSFRSTQSDSILRASTSDDSKGFFGSNVTLIGLILIALIASIVMTVRNNGDLYTSIFNVFQTSAQFVINFWFPLVMMYYLIRKDTNYWFQIVAGVSLSVVILMMCRDWWKVSNQAVPITPVFETFKQMFKDLWNTFPISPYLKYVENTDIMEVAKRVMTVALLCYVAYLMISVYKFKNRLVPCTETNFASCFRSMDGGSGGLNFMNTFFAGDKSKADDSSKNTTPYVNALWWTLIASGIVNAVNWLMQLFPIYNWINDWANGTTTPTPSTNTTMGEKVMQLLKLLVFPFYWTFSLFVSHPMATIIAFMAFAAVGLLLYRSSFDLTDFVEGQRGTMITLFAMFIASLVMFGVYSASSSAEEIVQAPISYGQFIGKTGMVIAIAVCIVGLLMYFLNSHSKLSTITSIVEFGITALIYIAGIAIVVGLARTMFSTSRKMGDSMFQVSADSNWVINVLKLLGNLLFYLPCLLLDFVEMLKEQYKLTTHSMLILLAMEAAFILAGHLLPSAIANVINHTGVQILSAPISMNPSTKISTYDIQFVNAHGVEEIPVPTADPKGGVATATVLLKNYSYGVSAWFYIHPQPPNTNANYSNDYINLMQFGPFGPSMQYNPKTNAMQFGLYGKPIESSANAPLEVSDIPLQTWNNVVINSDKGAVDIFINNKLIYTGTDLPENQTYASSIYNVTVGQADGVNGEMCNIVLNTAPFTKPEIAWLYKTNKVLNPPVVGVNMDPLNQGDAASYLATEAVDKDAPKPTPMPTISTNGARTYGILGAVLGAIFGWLFNHESQLESVKGLLMGGVVFGLIGALLGALFSTDGTLAYVLKTVANVFVDTF
jgi:hypothetical protein